MHIYICTYLYNLQLLPGKDIETSPLSNCRRGPATDSGDRKGTRTSRTIPLAWEPSIHTN